MGFTCQAKMLIAIPRAPGDEVLNHVVHEREVGHWNSSRWRNSSLARTGSRGAGPAAGIPSEASSPELLGSAGNGGNEENAIAFLEAAGFAAEEADVFFVEIDVEELANLTLIVAHVAREIGVPLGEFVQRRGAIASVAGNSAAMASVVFSPLPVMHTTVVSSGLMRFCAMSFCVTPVVTPPAVSVKMPSVSARSLMAATISGSETSSAQPPDSRICFTAKGPSAGLPMASDRAMVLGFCGLKRARLRFTASEIGEQPVACAPKNFTGLASTHPRVTSSRNAFAILVMSEPPAMGTTTLSGSVQPSCSAIS